MESPTSSNEPPAITHTINVGAGGFAFDPESLHANVGDLVEWRFFPRNHSVVQAAYRYPCVPVEYIHPTVPGFYSGQRVIAAGETESSLFAVRINDSAPVFYYCSTAHSCVYEGMIGVINPNSTWTLQNQKQFLADTTLQLSPGDSYPTEGPPSSAESTGNEQGGHQSASQDTAHWGLSTTHVVAISATVVLACLAIVAAVCIFGRRLLKQQLSLPHASIQPRLDGPEDTQVAMDQRLSVAAPQQATGPGLLNMDVTLHQNERRIDDLRTEMLDTAPPTDPPIGRDQACGVYTELPTSPSVSRPVSQQVPPPYSCSGRRFSWEGGSENAYRPSKPTW